MSQKPIENKAQKDVEKNVLGVFDFIVDALAQLIALIVSIFLPISIGTSQNIAGIVSKYKYEILKYFALFIGMIFLTTTLNLNGGSQNRRQGNIIGGSTEITDISGVEATVLNIPYFNQFINGQGEFEPSLPVPGGLQLGGVICGAASSTMVAGYYGALPFTSESDLKEYSYKDKGLDLPSKCNNTSIGGAFGVTSYNSLCNQSSSAGINAYFSLLGINTFTGWGSPNFNTIKQAIDQSKPVIISLTTSDGYGHIAVIKGYTADGRYVMNDPWTDVQSGNRGYSYAGNNALYLPDLGNQGYFKYYHIIG